MLLRCKCPHPGLAWLRRHLFENKVRDLAALRLTVSVLGQFGQHANQVRQLERRDTAGKRTSEARGIDRLVHNVSPWHKCSGDPVADHGIGKRKDAGLLKFSQTENGVLHSMRRSDSVRTESSIGSPVELAPRKELRS